MTEVLPPPVSLPLIFTSIPSIVAFVGIEKPKLVAAKRSELLPTDQTAPVSLLDVIFSGLAQSPFIPAIEVPVPAITC